jgi:hypothetical protein
VGGLHAGIIELQASCFGAWREIEPCCAAAKYHNTKCTVAI